MLGAFTSSAVIGPDVDAIDGALDGPNGLVTNGPLDGLRVVDVTDLRGALCGRILADLGADVVRVEPPGVGERLNSTADRYRNSNKRAAMLDIATPVGRDALNGFLANADVLVDNLGPTAVRGVGLDPVHLGAEHPHLVHVAIADFGLSGPRSGWRLEPLPAFAASGALFASGFPELPPCWMPGFLAHDCASLYGAIGAVAAVMDRSRTGLGQLVEVSVQEAALVGTTPWSVAIEDYLKVNPSLPAEGRRNADGNYWVLPASDGWVRTVVGNDGQWNGFLDLLGYPEVLSGPEWKDTFFRRSNGDVVRIVAEDILTTRTRGELFDQAGRNGATLGVIQTPSEFVAHEEPRSRGVFVDSNFEGLEGAPFILPPVRMSVTPPTLRRGAPGVSVDAVPWTARERKSVPTAASERAGLLLDGIRVVEFGMAVVVPELCLVLSELGADVIKIESESHLDVLRLSGKGRINCSFAFNVECRGRRSVALNLETVRGRELAFELCRTADVVAENYRGGVLDDLGLGYEAVREVNPQVVYVSTQGYGREGPLARTRAYGPLNLGFVGLHTLWNHADAPYPCGTSLNHPDHVAGKLLAISVLAALAHRERSGEGQLIDMAQTDCAAFLHGEVYLDAHLAGSDPNPQGNSSDAAVPHGVYPAAGDDEWLAVAVPDDNAWRRLCHALGWEAHGSTATLAGRLERRDEIDERFAAWSVGRPAAESADILQSQGVSAMPVMGPQDHLTDPHLLERNFIVHLEHPEVGEERHAGNPILMSRLEQRVATSAPCFGVDTEEVLYSVLGLSRREVAKLRETGVCS